MGAPRPNGTPVYAYRAAASTTGGDGRVTEPSPPQGIVSVVAAVAVHGQDLGHAIEVPDRGAFDDGDGPALREHGLHRSPLVGGRYGLVGGVAAEDEVAPVQGEPALVQLDHG